MNIVKQYVQMTSGVRVVVRYNHYGHTFSLIQALVDVAVGDFPEVKTADIDIVQYGGDRIKRHWGIEFDWPVTPDNPEYQRIPQLEYIL